MFTGCVNKDELLQTSFLANVNLDQTVERSEFVQQACKRVPLQTNNLCSLSKETAGLQTPAPNTWLGSHCWALRLSGCCCHLLKVDLVRLDLPNVCMGRSSCRAELYEHQLFEQAFLSLTSRLCSPSHRRETCANSFNVNKHTWHNHVARLQGKHLISITSLQRCSAAFKHLSLVMVRSSAKQAVKILY